jgi:YtkA-like
VLIVTPVIFFSLRAWQLRLPYEPVPVHAGQSIPRGRLAIGLVAGLVILVSVWAGWHTLHRGGTPPGSDVTGVVRTVQSGTVQIRLRSSTGVLQQGRNTFTFEFRAAPSGELIDVGTVRASANMPMPGMVMSSGMEVHATDVKGRYDGSAEFGMAGAWQMSVEWDGPAGRGSAAFEGPVQ